MNLNPDILEMCDDKGNFRMYLCHTKTCDQLEKAQIDKFKLKLLLDGILGLCNSQKAEVGSYLYVIQLKYDTSY